MAMRDRWPLLAPALLGSLAAGCFSPDYGDGGASCATSHDCSDGYVCNPEGEDTSFCRPAQSRLPAITRFIVTPDRVSLKELPRTLGVTILVENFKIQLPADPPVVEPRFGHFHIYLVEAGNAIYASLKTANPTEIVADTTQPESVFYRFTKTGTFQLRTVLVHANHTELAPVVEVRTPLTVTP